MRRLLALLTWLHREATGSYLPASWLQDHERRASYLGVERHTGSIVLPINKLRDAQAGWNARRLKQKQIADLKKRRRELFNT